MSSDRAFLPALSFEIDATAAERVGERLAPFVDAHHVEAEIRARLLTVAPAIAHGVAGIGSRLRVEADIGAHDVQLVIAPADDQQLEVWARFERPV